MSIAAFMCGCCLISCIWALDESDLAWASVLFLLASMSAFSWYSSEPTPNVPHSVGAVKYVCQCVSVQRGA